ncbi:hypothetical protein PBRA_005098 [Plasmodiophora brassicae]|nr:hypothetical protein PBRA_005098 [Plasmodiophora brassicae]
MDDDPNRYIVAVTDFRRVPRWQGDALCGTPNPSDGIQAQLTTLLGGWASGKRFDDMPDGDIGKNFLLSLPFFKQKQHADATDDPVSAITYLLEHRNDDDVQSLLSRATLTKAVKHGQLERFPGLMPFLTKLAQAGLASDRNLRALFGDESRVRGVMLEVGSMLAQPPPAGSPAEIMMRAYTDGTLRARPLPCAQCGYLPDDTKNLICAGCKSVAYCCRDCQKENWPLHRPDCLRKQGRPVPEQAERVAERIRQAKYDEIAERTRAEEEARDLAVRREIELFRGESPHAPVRRSHTCMGVMRVVDTPSCAVDVIKSMAADLGLAFVETVNFGLLPDGIPENLGRGVALRNPSTQAFILVMHTRLFADNGDGNLSGHALDGIFVASVTGGRIRWVSVSQPADGGSGRRCNRYRRLYRHLAHAKSLARIPTASYFDDDDGECF